MACFDLFYFVVLFRLSVYRALLCIRQDCIDCAAAGLRVSLRRWKEKMKGKMHVEFVWWPPSLSNILGGVFFSFLYSEILLMQMTGKKRGGVEWGGVKPQELLLLPLESGALVGRSDAPTANDVAIQFLYKKKKEEEKLIVHVQLALLVRAHDERSAPRRVCLRRPIDLVSWSPWTCKCRQSAVHLIGAILFLAAISKKIRKS